MQNTSLQNFVQIGDANAKYMMLSRRLVIANPRNASARVPWFYTNSAASICNQ